MSIINDATDVYDYQRAGIKIVNQQTQLSVEMETIPEKGELMIIDEIGRQVFAKVLDKFNQKLYIEMSMLDSGFYSVLISSQNGHFVEKFITY